MNKFDIVNKIRMIDLVASLLKKRGNLPYQELKNYLGIAEGWQANYFNWGRNALFWLFKNLKYKKITFPAFTCPTLVQAAEKAGKQVVLTDIDLNTFNLDINRIPKDTECLTVVHTFGNPISIQKIRKRFKEIYIIEDCAHALYASINNQFVGKQGNAILFSLYKQIPNINGSLLLTKDKIFLNQPQELNFKYLKRIVCKTKGVQEWLLNFKRYQYLPLIEEHKISKEMPNDLVLKLYSQGIKKLKKEVKRRQKVAEWYYDELQKFPYFISQKPGSKNAKQSYYQFVVRLKPGFTWMRDELGFILRQKNIFLGRLWYDAPITLNRYAKSRKICPKALLLSKSVLNLPIYGNYTEKDIHKLFKRIKKTIEDLMPSSN